MTQTCLVIFALSLVALADTHAQMGARAPPGSAGSLEREQLIARLESRQPVEGYVISGEDLHAALEVIDHRVQLSHCVIDDGLRLPGVVRVPFGLTDCLVKPAPPSRAPSAGAALYARGVRFAQQVEFSGTRFAGPAEFVGAQFDEQASFNSAEFREGAIFSDAHFAGDASFLQTHLGAGTTFTDADFHGNTRFANATFRESVPILARFRGPVSFRNAHFKGEVHFAGPGGRGQFGDAVVLQDAVFEGPAHFRDVVFEGEANVAGASFETAIFTGGTFHGAARFDGATFAMPPQLQAHFHSRASFRAAQFLADAHFTPARDAPLTRAAHFDEEVDFSAATFAERTDFSKARFAGSAVFKGADFRGPAAFQEARFEQAAYFNLARFGGRAQFFDSSIAGPITFAETRFSGPANFLRVDFGDTADFAQTHFTDRAYFARAIFGGDVIFRSACFEANADFTNGIFRGLADFQGAQVSGVLILKNTTYGAYADLREARLRGLDFNSSERPSIVSARFDMRSAQLGEAHFEDVIFEQEVDLSDAAFGEPASGKAPSRTLMRFVTFESPVSMARARFQGQVVLENVKFQDVADFTDVRFLPNGGQRANFALSYVDFSALRIRWAQLPAPALWMRGEADRIEPPFGEQPVPQALEPRPRVLKRLETSFRARGELADANQAYYHRKHTELQEARRQGFTGERLWREAEWWLWGVTSGYGTRLAWVLGWALLVDVVFALLYWGGATIHRESHPVVERDHRFQPRLLDLPKQYLTEKPVRITHTRLVDALRVSSVILFKIGYRDTTLSGTLGGIPVSRFVRFEWALGYCVIAALIVTLGNTQPLINQLVTGLF